MGLGFQSSVQHSIAAVAAASASDFDAHVAASILFCSQFAGRTLYTAPSCFLFPAPSGLTVQSGWLACLEHSF